MLIDLRIFPTKCNKPTFVQWNCKMDEFFRVFVKTAQEVKSFIICLNNKQSFNVVQGRSVFRVEVLGIKLQNLLLNFKQSTSIAWNLETSLIQFFFIWWADLQLIKNFRILLSTIKAYIEPKVITKTGKKILWRHFLRFYQNTIQHLLENVNILFS